jgi:hypothetical protein
MAVKLDPMLTKAIRLASGKKHGDAIRLLEPEVVRYHDSFNYYYILGSSCLRVGDFGGGYTYFRRAREIKMRNPDVLLGMAVCHLRRGDTERAIDFYLEVQELNPRNRIVKKALAILRKHSGRENLSAWIDSGKIHRLFPRLLKPSFPWPRFFLGIALFLILLASAGGILLKTGFPDRRRNSERQDMAGIRLEREDRDTPVQVGGSYRYILTRDQVLETFEHARTLFTEYRDEAAKVALNRIIESNAAESIKNKARLLISYTEVPGFDTLKDRFSYAEVIQEPILYRDCYVIWQGMATNLDIQEAGFSFDFLVGYNTRRVLEGIVPVAFDFSETVDPERPLEVLGRVVPVLGAGGEGVRLEGVALHQSAFTGARQ